MAILKWLGSDVEFMRGDYDPPGGEEVPGHRLVHLALEPTEEDPIEAAVAGVVAPGDFEIRIGRETTAKATSLPYGSTATVEGMVAAAEQRRAERLLAPEKSIKAPRGVRRRHRVR